MLMVRLVSSAGGLPRHAAATAGMVPPNKASQIARNATHHSTPVA